MLRILVEKILILTEKVGIKSYQKINVFLCLVSFNMPQLLMEKDA